MKKQKHRIISLGCLAIFVILFFVFDSFIYSQIGYFKFCLNASRTPIDIEQEEMASVIGEEVIEVSVLVYRVESPWSLKTYRDEENIENFLEKASRILNQASVKLKLVEIIPTNLKGVFNEDEFFLKPLIRHIMEMPNYREDHINLVLLKKNPGFGSIHFGGCGLEEERIAFVIDRSRNLDYKILAHEIGHVFGLEHPGGSSFAAEGPSLMATGFLLDKEEATKIYEEAKLMIGQRD